MRTKTARVAAALTLGLVALLLTPAAASTGNADASLGAAVDIALRYVDAQAQSLGLSAGDVDDVAVTDAYTSAHNGVSHVYLRQRMDGLEVAGSEMTVNVTRAGEVLYAPSHFVADLDANASGSPVLTAAAAVRAAATALDLGGVRDVRVLAADDSAARTTLLSPSGISLQAIPARLLYQALADGTARLAWNLEIEELSQQHWWNVSIDAETGAMLATTDYIDHDSAQDMADAIARPSAAAAASESAPDGASYRVYAVPLESPNDGPRTLVTNPADALASPHGWHDTNNAAGAESTLTVGNNAEAYIDTTNAHIVSPSPLPGMTANGGASLRFDFPLDFAQPPTAWKDAAVTNLFYWNNIVHDVFYRYGFTEEAGNFQVNNYARGGAGNDSVRAEAQDGSGTNNANFGTPADGSRPRMQMYLWPRTSAAEAGRIIDGDLDSGVITHEYGHGISNRLTGGPSNVGCLGNQEQMGEGWSDWLALALTGRADEIGADPRGMGTYVLAQANRKGAGIRVTPYSTNMQVNPSTYDRVKTVAVPHGIGYVWATFLWDVYWGLVDTYGFNPDKYADWTTAGNNLAIQLVMDGMKMQVCSPGFVDGRDAILAADVALTGGDNQCLLWGAFARRGLGLSAEQGASTSRSDGTEAFDLPASCSA